MPSFDHHAAGPPEHAWQRAGLADLPALPVPAGRLLVLAAHPDDETLGAGGLLAASARAGAEIVVVIATDGEASHPDSLTHPPERLGSIRRAEVRAALHVLAPRAAIHHLGLPDGRLRSHADALDAALTDILDRTGSALLVTPWRADRHPDHEACAEAGERVARRHGLEHWQFPIWMWHWADPADPLPARLHRLELDEPARTAKHRALAAHVSQHTPLTSRPGDEAILSPRMLSHFRRPYECFISSGPTEAPPPVTAQYFEDLYSATPDPWDLAGRFYEQRKRDLVMAALPRRRFRRAFEPGCAAGLLTVRLASRVDDLTAWDVADVALEQARARLAEQSPAPARVERGGIPAQWPEGDFDLIMLCEVGYYCNDLDLLVERVLATLSDDGVLLACHWSHAAPDHPRTAAEVHGAFDRVLARTVQHVEADFRLDVWSREPTSVAAAEGIV